MNTIKIKYGVAVAALLAATAFCGCASDEEIVYTDKSIAMAESAGGGISAAYEEAGEDEARAGKESADDKEIRVYVCGAVKDPGVYTLRRDERMVDAVDAAGGFTDDAGCDYLNLAAILTDGQKVYVPTVGEIEKAIEAGEEIYSAQVNITQNSPGLFSGDTPVQTGDGLDTADPDGSGLVNINTADAQTLMTLPGIGQSKADKIIAFREENGDFARIEDLMLIGGIKEGLFKKVKDRICVR